MLQALSPGVEDHQATNRCAQPFPIRRDPQERRRRRPKQEVIDDTFIGQGETRQRLWHREDEVHVADRQELPLRAATQASRAAVRHLGQCQSRQLLYEGPTARTGRSDRGAHQGPRFDTGQWPGGHADGARSPRRGVSPGNHRRVGARCRPPRRVAVSPPVLQPRASRGVRRREGERVQGTRDGLEMLLREMEVRHRVPDLHVAEEQLNRPQVGAAFQ